MVGSDLIKHAERRTPHRRACPTRPDENLCARARGFLFAVPASAVAARKPKGFFRANEISAFARMKFQPPFA
jgi:hypothetical protein